MIEKTDFKKKPHDTTDIESSEDEVVKETKEPEAPERKYKPTEPAKTSQMNAPGKPKDSEGVPMLERESTSKGEPLEEPKTVHDLPAVTQIKSPEDKKLIPDNKPIQLLSDLSKVDEIVVLEPKTPAEPTVTEITRLQTSYIESITTIEKSDFNKEPDDTTDIESSEDEAMKKSKEPEKPEKKDKPTEPTKASQLDAPGKPEDSERIPKLDKESPGKTEPIEEPQTVHELLSVKQIASPEDKKLIPTDDKPSDQPVHPLSGLPKVNEKLILEPKTPAEPTATDITRLQTSFIESITTIEKSDFKKKPHDTTDIESSEGEARKESNEPEEPEKKDKHTMPIKPSQLDAAGIPKDSWGIPKLDKDSPSKAEPLEEPKPIHEPPPVKRIKSPEDKKLVPTEPTKPSQLDAPGKPKDSERIPKLEEESPSKAEPLEEPKTNPELAPVKKTKSPVDKKLMPTDDKPSDKPVQPLSDLPKVDEMLIVEPKTPAEPTVTEITKLQTAFIESITAIEKSDFKKKPHDTADIKSSEDEARKESKEPEEPEKKDNHTEPTKPSQLDALESPIDSEVTPKLDKRSPSKAEPLEGPKSVHELKPVKQIEIPEDKKLIPTDDKPSDKYGQADEKPIAQSRTPAEPTATDITKLQTLFVESITTIEKTDLKRIPEYEKLKETEEQGKSVEPSTPLQLDTIEKPVDSQRIPVLDTKFPTKVEPLEETKTVRKQSPVKQVEAIQHEKSMPVLDETAQPESNLSSVGEEQNVQPRMPMVPTTTQFEHKSPAVSPTSISHSPLLTSSSVSNICSLGRTSPINKDMSTDSLSQKTDLSEHSMSELNSIYTDRVPISADESNEHIISEASAPADDFTDDIVNTTTMSNQRAKIINRTKSTYTTILNKTGTGLAFNVNFNDGKRKLPSVKPITTTTSSKPKFGDSPNKKPMKEVSKIKPPQKIHPQSKTVTKLITKQLDIKSKGTKDNAKHPDMSSQKNQQKPTQPVKEISKPTPKYIQKQEIEINTGLKSQKKSLKSETFSSSITPVRKPHTRPEQLKLTINLTVSQAPQSQSAIATTTTTTKTFTKTSSRIHGYMQSTVSRDQKIGKTVPFEMEKSQTRTVYESPYKYKPKSVSRSGTPDTQLQSTPVRKQITRQTEQLHHADVTTTLAKTTTTITKTTVIATSSLTKSTSRIQTPEGYTKVYRKKMSSSRASTPDKHKQLEEKKSNSSSSEATEPPKHVRKIKKTKVIPIEHPKEIVLPTTPMSPVITHQQKKKSIIQKSNENLKLQLQLQEKDDKRKRELSRKITYEDKVTKDLLEKEKSQQKFLDKKYKPKMKNTDASTPSKPQPLETSKIIKDSKNTSLIPIKKTCPKSDDKPLNLLNDNKKGSKTVTTSRIIHKEQITKRIKPKIDKQSKPPQQAQPKATSPQKQPEQMSTKLKPFKPETTKIKKIYRQYYSDNDDDYYEHFRCKSALPYSTSSLYKDKLSSEKLNEPSSLPSSPIRMKQKLNKTNITNSTKLLTSEVFTRTIDTSQSIEVIYRQPYMLITTITTAMTPTAPLSTISTGIMSSSLLASSTISNEAFRRAANDYKYNDADVSLIDTTDSSLSDSIALPSSSSDHDVESAFYKRKRSCSPSTSVLLSSTTSTFADSRLGSMTTCTTSSGTGIVKRSAIVKEQKIRRSEPKLGDFSNADDKSIIEEDKYQLLLPDEDPTKCMPEPKLDKIFEQMSSSSSSMTTVTNVILHEDISPILDINVVSPLRQKHKFDYNTVSDTDVETLKQTVEFGDEQHITEKHEKIESQEHEIETKGDADKQFDNYLQNEAINLVDSVLEQSIFIINSQQYPDSNLTLRSESEHFAITCDVNGLDLIKSPTIESMSGKSFDDNISVSDDHLNVENLNVVVKNVNVDIDGSSSSCVTGDVVSSLINTNNSNFNNTNNINNNSHDHEQLNSSTFSKIANGDRLERKFEKLSSQLDIDFNQIDQFNQYQLEFDKVIDENVDQDDNLLSDFSKISWDESVSATTAGDLIGGSSGSVSGVIGASGDGIGGGSSSGGGGGGGDDAGTDYLSTPDNDFQDQLKEVPGFHKTVQFESNIPKPTPRLTKSSITIESSSRQIIPSDITKKNDQTSSKPISVDIQEIGKIKTDENVMKKKRTDETSISSSSSSSYKFSGKDDVKSENIVTVGDRTSGDYSETKKFWETLDKQDDATVTTTATVPSTIEVGETTKVLKPSGIPVPKPRLSQPTNILPTKASVASTITAVAADDSLEISQEDSSTKISSERQVEYSETSSLLTDSKNELLKDDDSINLEVDAMDVDDDKNLVNESVSDKLDKDSTDDNKSKTSFYIGESSVNIIKKSSSDKKLVDSDDDLAQQQQENAQILTSSDILKIGTTTSGPSPPLSSTTDYNKTDLKLDLKTTSGEKFSTSGKPDDEADTTDADIDVDEGEVAEDDYDGDDDEITAQYRLHLKSKKLDKTKQSKRISKSEILVQEFPEEFLVDDIPYDQQEQHLKQQQPQHRVNVVHSPIESYKSVIEFEKSIELQDDAKTIATRAQITKVDDLPVNIKSQLDRINESFATDSRTGGPKHIINQSIVEQTFAEIKDSLDAVQEDLIEVVKDGRLIKESPSEFQYKILPNVRYPQLESHQEEQLQKQKQQFQQQDQEHPLERQSQQVFQKFTEAVIEHEDMPVRKGSSPPYNISATDSSNEESFNKLDVIHRIKSKHMTTNRWSVTDPETISGSSGGSHYESFSRPCSSDVDNLYNTSEYQTAQDLSSLQQPGSSELFHTAKQSSSSDNSRNTTISSRDSMKSFDSESSGHLGSVEISEASETLVPSTMDDLEMDENELKLASLELSSGGVLLEDFHEDDQINSTMKRSQEMMFQPELKHIQQRDDDDEDNSDELLGISKIDKTIVINRDKEFMDSDKRGSKDEPLTSICVSEIGASVISSSTGSSGGGNQAGSDESKFATSLDDGGSILSISLSSCTTVVENLHDDVLAGSLTSTNSLIDTYEIPVQRTTSSLTGTSFEDSHSVSDRIDNIIMTTSIVHDDNNSVNTQITTTTKPSEELDQQPSSTSIKKTKGHKRTDSTSFLKGFEQPPLPPQSAHSIEDDEDECSLDDEMIIHEHISQRISSQPDEIDEKRVSSSAGSGGGGTGSGSDSDYDRYETEYSRSFKQPIKQVKKKSMIERKIDVTTTELERKKSIPSIETIVEDIAAEVELENKIPAPSQNMQDYSNIPDIKITDDPAKCIVDDDDDDLTFDRKDDEKALSKQRETKQKEASKKTTEVTSPIQYAKQSVIKITEEEYQDLIDKQYKTKYADITTKYDDFSRDVGGGGGDGTTGTDSPTSDSFEMLEQPDIADEFVIIEEVAKEADEFDTEGKSVKIKHLKYVKKHDEEVETLLVKSAPAATNEGSIVYSGRDDLGFHFEESPPTGIEVSSGSSGSGGARNDESGDSSNGGVAAETSSRKWIEMQLADQAQNLRYPYDMDRGILEDIKEEDTDFEVGSSRISSFKDSFSSTPEYDMLAGRKYFAREHDDISMSSLQEFESLEQAISFENRKFQPGSQDSLSNGSFPRRYNLAKSASGNSGGGIGGGGDDISLSSLKEFEGLENACLEAHLIEIRAKEEAALLLSRSDESNKSNKSDNGHIGKIMTTSATTKTTSDNGSSCITTVTTKTFTTRTEPMIKVSEQRITQSSGFITSKLESDCDDLMEVSSDSLDLNVSKQQKRITSTTTTTTTKTTGSGAFSDDTSHHGSTDSLEISKSNDIMTSSMDSIEISKGAGTGVSITGKSSSKSDADSIEQMLLEDNRPRTDSLDSIEVQYARMHSGSITAASAATRMDRDSIDSNTKIETHSTITTSGDQITHTKTITTTTSKTITGRGSDGAASISSLSSAFFPGENSADTTIVSIGGGTTYLPKDISTDSLNIEHDQLLTSTESLDHSFGSATTATTNATYQNEYDSQMSGSITSCGSNTLIDTLDNNYPDVYNVHQSGSGGDGISSIISGIIPSSTSTSTTTRSGIDDDGNAIVTTIHQVRTVSTRISGGETDSGRQFAVTGRNDGDNLETSRVSKKD